jgi:hypothetical protein
MDQIFDSVRDPRFGDSPRPVGAISPIATPFATVQLDINDLITRFNDATDGTGKGDFVSDVNETLQLIKSSTIPFNLKFLDKNGQPADLTGATAASLVIMQDLSGLSPAILSIDTTGELALDIPNSKVIASPTQDQADLFKPGTWVGQVCVSFSGVLKYSKYFFATILPAVAPVPA